MIETKHLPWLDEAVKYLGVKEIKGTQHNPTIISWLKELGGWWTDDETPWCGVFVAYCLKASGMVYPKHWYRALAYQEIGLPLSQPVYGCIAVLKRQGGGHVGFVVGEDKKGNLLILGGNQNDQVKVSAFSKDRVVAYVFPKHESKNFPMFATLPIRHAERSMSEV
ncbi:TIGR02594 family protein [Basilea psittacipulmonis]|uniref:TIGR02594 family protein n=1 Tax=Basilea psittacipulmonis TaxID=1472345 RepID=UPI00068C7955|nr:TIGR02594 family protein [Basilea psittacipulmonis]